MECALVPPNSREDLSPLRTDSIGKDRLTISFEFFPPRDRAAEDRLLPNIRRLEGFHPRFVSVTYGAGGSTRENTLSTAARIGAESVIPPAAHLTCIDASREEVDSVARDYWNSGIRHIVAIRGDPPGRAKDYEPHPHGYAYAADLVSGLRRIANFEISVAAYPEVHPEAASAAQDLTYLKRKLDAGAARAITQFFFNSDAFFRFVDHVRAAGIDAPIVAGIMPITNIKRVQQFSRHCGVTLPAELAACFERLQQDPAASRRQAIATAAEQCRRLHAQGQRAFHLYTMNDAGLAAAVCKQLYEPLQNQGDN